MYRPTLLALVALLVTVSPAWAHKMKVFAGATGATISGYVYFSPGGRAQQVTVRATGADGDTVFEGVTDDQGQFAFQATRRMDYVVSVDGGDGHAATSTISAAELPASLSAGPQGTETGTPAAVPAVSATSPAIAMAPAGDGDWRAFIDQSVARQIMPLREQIDAYQEKIWMHDVLGGIGYIVGIGGFMFGFFANRRQRQPVLGRERNVP